MWDAILNELTEGFTERDAFAAVTVRIVLGAIVGAALGIERSWTGKQAGMRTHMLVCLGSAIFVMCVSLKSETGDALSRVIQGTATGIGFVGAGAILKLSDRRRVKGLTTAANIWLTAALGSAIGTGHYYLPTAGVIAAWFTLIVVEQFEERIEARGNKQWKERTGADSTAKRDDDDE